MNEYASLAELKATLSMSGETFADADISLALTAASRGLDNVLDRRFYLDADANQQRFYTPDRPFTLLIDDLTTFTALAVDDAGAGTFTTAWTLNTDFVLEPLNAAADGRPFTTVSVHTNGSRSFRPGSRSVRLTGRFGWPAVPSEIKEATLMLAARLMRRTREAPFGVVSLGIDAGAAMHIARTDPDVKFLIEPFDRSLTIA